jgi:AbiV family abortive infection protein
LKLFCPDCAKLVDVVEGPMVQRVADLCGHKIKVRIVRFEHAKEGASICLRNARSLAQSAEILLEKGACEHAFFMILTAYEELAKCSRIVDAASQNSETRTDMIVEDSIFQHHKTKFAIAMHYLDHWIKTMEALRRAFPVGAAGIDIPDSEAARAEIREQGASMRESCLYEDYWNRWIGRPSVPEEKVRLHLSMFEQFASGFDISLESDANWQRTISSLSRQQEAGFEDSNLLGSR